jgi:hypothetical protein
MKLVRLQGIDSMNKPEGVGVLKDKKIQTFICNFLQANRNFIGIELSQEYVDIANKRLQQDNLHAFFQTQGVLTEPSPNRNFIQITTKKRRKSDINKRRNVYLCRDLGKR